MIGCVEDLQKAHYGSCLAALWMALCEARTLYRWLSPKTYWSISDWKEPLLILSDKYLGEHVDNGKNQLIKRADSVFGSNLDPLEVVVLRTVDNGVQTDEHVTHHFHSILWEVFSTMGWSKHNGLELQQSGCTTKWIWTTAMPQNVKQHNYNISSFIQLSILFFYSYTLILRVCTVLCVTATTKQLSICLSVFTVYKYGCVSLRNNTLKKNTPSDKYLLLLEEHTPSVVMMIRSSWSEGFLAGAICNINLCFLFALNSERESITNYWLRSFRIYWPFKKSLSWTVCCFGDCWVTIFFYILAEV